MKPSLKKAKDLIQWYLEGSDLTDEQSHVLFDCAGEHGQMLDNVIQTSWFETALSENIEILDSFGPFFAL